MDEKNPKVSVILPVYNGVKTLKDTLDSLKHQTFKEFELICCIDGTTDGSEDLIKTYSSFFYDLKIVRNKKNLGLGSTMNRLISLASTEYVAVAEQDDYYYPDRLRLQYDVFEKNPEIGMVSGISEFWNGEKIVLKFPGLLVSGKQYPTGKEMFLLNYRNQVKVVNTCMMIRKKVHLENGLYFTKHYPSIGIDWTYVLRFSLVSNIYGIHQPLVRLDRREDRNSLTSDKTKLFKASRELIRSFRYEYPDIISKEDFKYAMNTQKHMEMNHLPMFKYLIQFCFNIITSPSEKRYYQSFKKRLKAKLGS